MNNPEILRPIAVHARAGVRTVKVFCPHCGHTHTHGWPPLAGPDPGNRVAHCGLGGYWILLPEEVDAA